MAAARRRRPAGKQTTTSLTTTTSTLDPTVLEQLRSMHETLWGGPEGEGLVHTVASQTKSNADLSKSLDNLTEALTRKADIAHGDDGEPISLRRVFDEIQMLKKVGFRLLWGLAVIGIATIIVLGHTLQLVYSLPGAH